MNTGVDWRFNAGPIDVDSELRNLNRAASRCPSNKYEPSCNDCVVGNDQVTMWTRCCYRMQK